MWLLKFFLGILPDEDSDAHVTDKGNVCNLAKLEVANFNVTKSVLGRHLANTLVAQ